jgi:hypothetical protein
MVRSVSMPSVRKLNVLLKRLVLAERFARTGVVSPAKKILRVVKARSARREHVLMVAVKTKFALRVRSAKMKCV